MVAAHEAGLCGEVCVSGGVRGSVIDNVKADGGLQGDGKNPSRWPNCRLFMWSRGLSPLVRMV